MLDCTIPEKTNLLNALAIGAALGEPQQKEGFLPYLITIGENGQTVVNSLEHLMVNPPVPKATIDVYETESFLAYIDRYRHATNDRLLIMADVTETDASFVAVLDYIHTGSAVAERGQHRINYTCKRTPEWSRWLGKNRQSMSQIEFAQFIEDNAPDFVDPSSAAMQEIALTLEAKTDGEFASATRLENGSHRLRYNETVTAKAGSDGNVDIPSAFTIGIAPFVGFAPWQMEVRLRYRIPGGKLQFWYELVRPHKVVEMAAKEIIAKITAGTGLVPLLGTIKKIGA